MDNSFMFLNYKYTIYQFSGKVVARDSETTVSTRGGNIHTNTYKDFFLLNNSGKEKHFSFNEIDLPPLRLGHIIQVMWVIKEGEKTGKYVFVRNVSLDEDSFIILNMDRTKKGKPAIIMITLTLLSLLMIIVGFISYLYAYGSPGHASKARWIIPILFFIGCLFTNLQISKSFQKILIAELSKRKLVI